MKSAERDLHAAETALAGARSRLRVFGKTDEEIARIESDRQVDRITRVPSPIAGTITARKVGPGQYVKPDSPDPLFTVANLSTVWILADVYESDVPLLKVGQPVEARVSAYPNEVFTAHIAYIAPAVDPTTHRVAVRGVIDNRGRRLKPDMFASLHIVTEGDVKSLAVPLGALLHDGDRTSVWVAQSDSQFVKREVTVGLEQDGYAQITSGLEPGEKVAAEGSLLLANAAATQD
jgi:membrane fusion protein, heavy metal efflux system